MKLAVHDCSAQTAPVSATGEPASSWYLYEQAAAAAMRQLGFPDAVVTPRGSDGGVDVRSARAVAQVKARLTATPRPEVQQLFGVARAEHKLGIFFSLAGFTAGAIEWAEQAGVALFVLESTGGVRPIGAVATALAVDARESLDLDLLGAEDHDGDEMPTTFGALLASARRQASPVESFVVHLPTGRQAVAHGRILARLVASAAGKPLRIIDASQLEPGGAIPVALMQRIVPGEVVYLEQVELFPEKAPLTTLAGIFFGRIDVRYQRSLLTALTSGGDAGNLIASLRSRADSPLSPETPAPHVLLFGPPGQGKSWLASVIASELGAEMHTVSGPALHRVGDIAGLLCSLEDGSVLFIDEIDRLAPVVEESLHQALEDGRISMTAGVGEAARAISLQLPPFVLVGGTTSPDMVPDRIAGVFDARVTLNLAPGALVVIVQNLWDQEGIAYDPCAVSLIAHRAQGSWCRAVAIARHAQRLARQVETPQAITREFMALAVDEYKLDDADFNEMDWGLLAIARGDAELHYVSRSTTPDTTVIASTKLSWQSTRDARQAFGPLAREFTATLVMPELQSTNETMLEWELSGLPLFR